MDRSLAEDDTCQKWRRTEPIEVETSVTVRVSTEWYMDCEAYFASTALSVEEPIRICIVCKRECQMADQGIEQVIKHNVSIWSGIQGRAPKIPSGC